MIGILRNIGAAYYSSGQYGEASSALQRALELDPTFATTWSNLGTARYFQGWYEDAVIAFQKAVELAPNNYFYGEIWVTPIDGHPVPETRRPMPTAGDSPRRRKSALNLNDTALRSSVRVVSGEGGRHGVGAVGSRQIGRTPSNSPATLFRTVLMVLNWHRNRDKALDALGLALKAGYTRSELDNEPELAALRSDPRYRAVVGSSPGGR